MMSVQLICQELKNKDRNWETNRKLSCFYSTTTGIKTSISHLNVYKTQVIETAKIQELIWKYNDKQKYLNIYFAAKTDEWEAIERNESDTPALHKRFWGNEFIASACSVERLFAQHSMTWKQWCCAALLAEKKKKELVSWKATQFWKQPNFCHATENVV